MPRTYACTHGTGAGLLGASSSMAPLRGLALAALVLVPTAATAAAAHQHLLIEPGFVVARSSGVRPVLANVTKEPRSPVLTMTEPWEVWVSYVWVVWAPEISRLVMYYNNEMCCDSANRSACPGSAGRDVLVCDSVRRLGGNVTGTEGNRRLSATLRAESVDGVTWTKPPLHQLLYNGSTANNALFLNQSLGGASDGRGVFRDNHDPDPNRRYKMAGRFNKGPNPGTGTGTHIVGRGAPVGYDEEPGCIPAGRCITDMQKSTVAAGAAACTKLPNCSSFSFYSVRI